MPPMLWDTSMTSCRSFSSMTFTKWSTYCLAFTVIRDRFLTPPPGTLPQSQSLLI